MKQCPSCRTTYTDDTLIYCLADGSLLNAPDDEQQTVVKALEATVAMGWDNPVRVDIPATVVHSQSGEQVNAASSPNVDRSSGNFLKILLVVVGLGIIAALAVVAGGIVYYSSSGGGIATNTANAATPQKTPAKDDRDELREQIANLEKRLDEQKKAGQIANVPIKQPNRSTTTTTATVNSPGDGFLALRTLPNSEAGERISKIPHGATVTIGACGPVVTPVKRSGRWCQATYGGMDGWVFDAYLIY